MTLQDLSGSVLIADDHPLFRAALRQVVATAMVGYGVIEAATFEAAMTAAEGDDLELILLDINMPGMNGLNGLIALRNHVPATPVIIVSADESPETIRQALTLGAAGFIPKSLDHDAMTAAVGAVLDGDVFVPANLTEEGAKPRRFEDEDEFRRGFAALTPQQRKVLGMIVRGKSNKVIAYEMGVTESTVKAHVSAILHKLGVTSRTQAALQAGLMLDSGQN